LKKTQQSFKSDWGSLNELLKKKHDQEGNEIIVHVVPNLHGRVFIIDDTVWSIDYSMNSFIGKSVTIITKLNNSKQEILDAYR
jgi:hypothetical protein